MTGEDVTQMPFDKDKYLQLIAEMVYARIPRFVPKKERLENCRLISHRGEFDNITVFENTLDAFDTLHKHGVWGVEFDIRWTKDLVPVVFHDPDINRVFNQDVFVRDITFAELKSRAPKIPSLEEAINRFGKKLHLMVEIKEEPYPDPERQNRILKDLFSPLEPAADYHICTLTPAMFSIVNFINAPIYFPIAWYDIKEMSDLVLDNGYCALAGHYVLLSNTLMKSHRAKGQKIGTGFPASKNVLFRELNRDVDWIFSNHAVALQKIIDRYLKKKS